MSCSGSKPDKALRCSWRLVEEVGRTFDEKKVSVELSCLWPRLGHRTGSGSPLQAGHSQRPSSPGETVSSFLHVPTLRATRAGVVQGGLVFLVINQG